MRKQTQKDRKTWMTHRDPYPPYLWERGEKTCFTNAWSGGSLGGSWSEGLGLPWGLVMKPEQLSQHLWALFQGWVTCPGAGKMQYNILRTLVEKNPAASQIASLQPSGPRLALGGGRIDGIFKWGTGQGSCSPLPTIHIKLLTMPETLQIIEDKKQNGSLPTKSLILPS